VFAAQVEDERDEAARVGVQAILGQPDGGDEPRLLPISASSSRKGACERLSSSWVSRCSGLAEQAVTARTFATAVPACTGAIPDGTVPGRPAFEESSPADAQYSARPDVAVATRL
jgi:hypothetical protein